MMTVRLPFVVLALLLALAFRGCGQQFAPAPMEIHPLIAARSTSTPVARTVAKSSEAAPVRLVIPAIGVNAVVERVGIAANGDLATPAVHPWDDAGWYDLGAYPGERGSVVIDGHLDRPGGYPAVFWNLRYLHNGDEVKVIDSRGKTLRYRVMQVAFYPPQAAPLQNIFGNNGGAYLNLITCAGDWIPSQHQTTLRLVVYTRLE